MLSDDIKRKIQILERMDLKVAVPQKLAPPESYVRGESVSTYEPEYIHVPSIIAMLIHEIAVKEKEMGALEKATKLIFNTIKRD